MTKLPFTIRVISCALILSAMNQPVHAKGFTFSPEVYLELGFDDNVYLLADEESAAEIIGSDSRSDRIIEAGAGIAAEYKDNGQEFQVDANLFRRDYDEFGVLDFTGGSIDAKWSRDSGIRWHTELGYNFRRDQSNFSQENLAQGDLFDQNRVYFELFNHLDESRDVYFKSSFQSRGYQLRDELENERYDVILGFSKTTPLGNSIGFELTRAEGDYPNILNFSQANESLQNYSEDQATIKIEWSPGERSNLKADIGYINRAHNNELSEFDFSGLVYDFRFQWEVGYRTELTAQYVKQLRDTQNTNTIFNQQERLKTSLKWELSKKLSLTSSVTLVDADFVQSGGNRKDFATLLEAGLKYKLDRRSTLGFALKTRTRNSNNALSEYDSNLAFVNYRRAL